MRKIMTLCLICKDNKVLLGLKKRGFGIGKWNGFGGKVNKGETIEEATKRELFEESGLTTNNIEKMGVLDFSWHSKPEILQVNIFKCTNFSGILTENEEMKPEWFDLDKIPFENMWPDDKHWFPLFLEGKKFNGKFVFDDNNSILKQELKEIKEV